MFTGIIEKKGKIISLTRKGEVAQLEIDAGWDDLQIGESVSVSGVCLTVEQAQAGPRVASGAGRFWATLTPETIQRTTLSRLSRGDAVNLERALRVGDRWGGHFVAGHVDGVGEVVGFSHAGDAADLTIEAPAELAPYLAMKGSVAVEGVSLTIADLSRTRFTAALVKHTLEATTLGSLRPGDAANLEVDLLARYVEKMMRSSDTDHQRMLDLLTREGYV